MEAQLFKTPVAVVSIPERDGGSANFLQVLEDAPMNDLFLHGPSNRSATPSFWRSATKA
ncbi:hypothetical protein PQQ65_31005 [Paraburkholderia strydomiana]|uniref:hypothetical protein n=1 Tax=Paraburkholderia strydomiana TaxID=1245417 RepID=UPI0038B93901